MKFNLFKKNSEINNIKSTINNLTIEINNLKTEFNNYKLSEKNIQNMINENKINIRNIEKHNKDLGDNFIKLENDIDQIEKNLQSYYKNQIIEDSIHKECNIS